MSVICCKGLSFSDIHFGECMYYIEFLKNVSLSYLSQFYCVSNYGTSKSNNHWFAYDLFYSIQQMMKSVNFDCSFYSTDVLNMFLCIVDKSLALGL